MKSWLYYTFRLSLVVGAACLFSARTIGAESSSLRTLEGLVGRWVDLRGQLTDERRSWKNKSAQWQQEMDLLRQEEKRLSSALAKLEAAGESRQERRADLIDRREQLQQAVNDVNAVLNRFEPSIVSLASQIPPSLMTSELESVLNPLPGNDDKGADVTARLQRILSAMAAIETLQSELHVTRAMIALPGDPRREMDVIFIGLACGYAVTADNRLAAAGHPTPDGWQWSLLAAEAVKVRELIEIAHKDVAPALVSFPVGIAVGEGEIVTP